jgi:hypothetical protein
LETALRLSICHLATISVVTIVKGTEESGWRWHKWGEYIGLGKPTREYLNDEPEFADGIYTYHIFEVE